MINPGNNRTHPSIRHLTNSPSSAVPAPTPSLLPGTKGPRNPVNTAPTASPFSPQPLPDDTVITHTDEMLGPPPTTAPAAPTTAPAPAPYQPPAAPTPGNPFPAMNSDAWGDLRGHMVMPEQGADVMALRDLMSQMGTDLGNLPDRSTLAKEQMDLYNTEAQEMLDQRVRGIGREAAAFGRIGSGVTTSKVGDAYAEAEKNRAREEARLANETAGLRQRDMLGALSGISSIQSLLSGQDVGRRNEVRGERGYANNLAQQQLQNRIQQWMTEQNALGMDQDLMMAIAQMSGNWGNQQPNWPQHPNYPGGGGY